MDTLQPRSELSLLHCKQLPNLNSTFNSLLSSSYITAPCNSSICNTQTRDLILPASYDPHKLCHIIVSYADSSSVEGTLAAETFSIGGAAQPGTLFGCMDSARYTFDADEDSKTTGLMGMNRAGDPNGTPQILVLHLQEGCLWSPPSRWGSRRRAVAGAAEIYTFTLGDQGFGETSATSEVGFLARPHRGGADDGGFGYPVHVSSRGAMDLCYHAPTSLAMVPAVTLVFEGAEMKVSGERLLYRARKESDWVLCFTFGNSDLLGIEAYVIRSDYAGSITI
ncbi:hypothetical protein V8G54_003276 [Vigna mungo]|uniref:Uncharacterized protein n=1 Tax=Vigna mungo TaxID=3915 RepID=A0AAQ3PBR3_VIGMU